MWLTPRPSRNRLSYASLSVLLAEFIAVASRAQIFAMPVPMINVFDDASKALHGSVLPYLRQTLLSRVIYSKAIRFVVQVRVLCWLVEVLFY